MHLPEQIDTTDIRAADGLYTVLVNDEPLFTPKGHAVQVSSWDLANAMADELMAEGVVDLQRLTLYALYATQRDFIADRLDVTIGAILQHLPGDFELHPDPDPALAAKQLAAWAPLLAFLRDLGPELPMSRPLQDVQIPWETHGRLANAPHSHESGATDCRNASGDEPRIGGPGYTIGRARPGGGEGGFSPDCNRQHLARSAREELEQAEVFAAEMSQIVRRLLQYVRLSA